jgi:hypothetical protein
VQHLNGKTGSVLRSLERNELYNSTILSMIKILYIFFFSPRFSPRQQIGDNGSFLVLLLIFGQKLARATISIFYHGWPSASDICIQKQCFSTCHGLLCLSSTVVGRTMVQHLEPLSFLLSPSSYVTAHGYTACPTDFRLVSINELDQETVLIYFKCLKIPSDFFVLR